MRNGFNQFSIPYMNELTANQLGVASVFRGNTPLGFINQSLGTISTWFQGQEPCPYPGGCGPPGRPTTPGEFERIIRRLPGQTPTPGTPPIVGPGSPGVPGLPPEGTPEGDRVRDAMGLPRVGGGEFAANCSLFDLECWFSRALGSDTFKDAGKRIGLVLLGAALLIVAVVSLR